MCKRKKCARCNITYVYNESDNKVAQWGAQSAAIVARVYLQISYIAAILCAPQVNYTLRQLRGVYNIE